MDSGQSYMSLPYGCKKLQGASFSVKIGYYLVKTHVRHSKKIGQLFKFNC